MNCFSKGSIYFHKPQDIRAFVVYLTFQTNELYESVVCPHVFIQGATQTSTQSVFPYLYGAILYRSSHLCFWLSLPERRLIQAFCQKIALMASVSAGHTLLSPTLCIVYMDGTQHIRHHGDSFPLYPGLNPTEDLWGQMLGSEQARTQFQIEAKGNRQHIIHSAWGSPCGTVTQQTPHILSWQRTLFFLTTNSERYVRWITVLGTPERASER